MINPYLAELAACAVGEMHLRLAERVQRTRLTAAERVEAERLLEKADFALAGVVHTVPNTFENDVFIGAAVTLHEHLENHLMRASHGQ